MLKSDIDAEIKSDANKKGSNILGRYARYNEVWIKIERILI